MGKDEAAIETELQEKGKTAPRITPDDLDAEIAEVQYHVFPGSCLTICASPDNFDAAIGEKISFENARAKLWPLLGFRLRDRLSA